MPCHPDRVRRAYLPRQLHPVVSAVYQHSTDALLIRVAIPHTTLAAQTYSWERRELAHRIGRYLSNELYHLGDRVLESI